MIRDGIPRSLVRPGSPHPRAVSLLRGKAGLGRGEQEALCLFFAARADTLVSDDAAFVALLDQAQIPYLLPARVLVELAAEGHLQGRAALSALERMRPWIRPDVYRLARDDLGTFQGKR